MLWTWGRRIVFELKLQWHRDSQRYIYLLLCLLHRIRKSSEVFLLKTNGATVIEHTNDNASEEKFTVLFPAMSCTKTLYHCVNGSSIIAENTKGIGYETLTMII